MKAFPAHISEFLRDKRISQTDSEQHGTSVGSFCPNEQTQRRVFLSSVGHWSFTALTLTARCLRRLLPTAFTAHLPWFRGGRLVGRCFAVEYLQHQSLMDKQESETSVVLLHVRPTQSHRERSRCVYWFSQWTF